MLFYLFLQIFGFSQSDISPHQWSGSKGRWERFRPKRSWTESIRSAIKSVQMQKKANISRQGHVIRHWNTGFIIIKLFPTFPNFYKSDDRSILKLSVVGQGRWYLFGKVELFLATLQLAQPCDHCGQNQNSSLLRVWIMILGDWNVIILFYLSHFASWEKRTFRQN